MNYRINILKVIISAQIVGRGAAGCGFARHADSSLFNESYLYAACFLTFKNNARGLLVLITEAQSPWLELHFYHHVALASFALSTWHYTTALRSRFRRSVTLN